MSTKAEIQVAIDELKKALVSCNRFNYCSDQVAEMERVVWALLEVRNTSARKWRESFDAMHQRAMNSERKLREYEEQNNISQGVSE